MQHRGVLTVDNLFLIDDKYIDNLLTDVNIPVVFGVCLHAGVLST